MPYDEAVEKYKDLKPGWNEDIFYIENPALGLWALEGAFESPPALRAPPSKEGGLSTACLPSPPLPEGGCRAATGGC